MTTKRIYQAPITEPVTLAGNIAMLAGSPSHTTQWKGQVGYAGNYEDEQPNGTGGLPSLVGDVTGDEGPASTAKQSNLWDTW